MGLAAPKKYVNQCIERSRTRISNDPQNTTWANNTSRFGHRMLTQQGWKPGTSLGAADAAHAAHYTAASHSHIRVMLKDDNLGLGAKRGSERAENFGLAGLESILGRLNGNTEEIKKEEDRKDKIQQRAYVYRKYGFMNFVSAGYLVGDKIEKKVKTEPEVKVEVKSEPESDSGAEKSKKRKRSSTDVDVKKEDSDDEEQRKLKRKRKSNDLREEATKESSKKDKKKEKKDKKDKKSKKSKSGDDSSSASPVPEEELSDKAKRKAEKRAKKEEKKLKKALKKAAKEAARSNDASSSESEEESTTATPATSTPTTGTSTPLSSASGLSFNISGRHAVRQRYIRNKKAASMDPQALKEILMIKTPS
ncbi:hypothetical protein BS50DRAFT_575603 [Corynespora cassiicola Philippines]|uniref:PinX1-related protein 1 n=1 Tax=Corynespora cassiicola Philippines TaxID=1448308 RepID=A0A2T2NJK4_CORCC|nr:hypothetical protein BS50DRAFT_575603 [Corynespora cassiicola Philippines]